MKPEPTTLYDDGRHKCLSFTSLVEGEGIQSNQFLVIDGEHACLIDPGGELTFTPLSVEVGKYIRLKNLDYVLASHQDPDIITALPRWLMQTDCRIVCSSLWVRFLPHLASTFVTEQMRRSMSSRIVALPDRGDDLQLGNSVIKCLPAHFLHSVGNFQFYDAVSKILFSGDMGASVVEDAPEAFVEDFSAHIPHMEGFHRRYMCSNSVCLLWANMVRTLDVDMIVPQHGRPFRGAQMINRFLDWISQLECGVDLMRQEDYRVP